MSQHKIPMPPYPWQVKAYNYSFHDWKHSEDRSAFDVERDFREFAEAHAAALRSRVEELEAERDELRNNLQQAQAECWKRGAALSRTRDEVLEEAAQIAEQCYGKSAFHFDLGTEAAKHIRALKTKGDDHG